MKATGSMPRKKARVSAGAARNGPAARLREAVARDLGPDALCRLLAALKKQWKRYRKGLKKCQEKFSEPAVHNSRVETRRLLSILELLGPFLGPERLKKARAALKRHLDTFGDLRDTHVQLLTVKEFKKRLPGLEPFEQYLLKREKRFTRKTRKNVKRIRTKRLGKLLSSWGDEIGRVYGDAALPDAHARLRNGLQLAFDRTAQLQANINPEETSTIHSTRVAFKRFRYMIEVVTGLVPGTHTKLLCSLHDYQTLMGAIQDAEVLLQTFSKFVPDGKLDAETETRFSEELQQRRRQLVRNYLDRSEELFVFDPGPQAVPRRRKRAELIGAESGSKAISTPDSRKPSVSDVKS